VGHIFSPRSLASSKLLSKMILVVVVLLLLLLLLLWVFVQDPYMQVQSAAAASSGVIRVPKLPAGADASSSAGASEAIMDARSVAGEGWAVGGGGCRTADEAVHLQQWTVAPCDHWLLFLL
jgi:preprotein translocase subunit SecG